MLHRSYNHCGKQVLLQGRHVADAVDPETAGLIAEALNHAPACVDPERNGVASAINETPRWWFEPDAYSVDDMPHDEPSEGPASLHHIQRQNDEYACKCGARWPVADGEDHP